MVGTSGLGSWNGHWVAIDVIAYWCVLRMEFSGMIHWPANNQFHHPSNPQQPIQQPYVKRSSKL